MRDEGPRRPATLEQRRRSNLHIICRSKAGIKRAGFESGENGRRLVGEVTDMYPVG